MTDEHDVGVRCRGDGPERARGLGREHVTHRSCLIGQARAADLLELLDRPLVAARGEVGAFGGRPKTHLP